MPKVSVIIPNYNHAKFLALRVESVLTQTFNDFEVIFLDDASTDNSLEVFAPFSSDPRIRVVCNATNSGSPFKQWKKGLDLARGEYVWIAESDDFADEVFLERLTTVLDNNPNVGLVFCQSWLVDEANKQISLNNEWTNDLNQQRWLEYYVNNGYDEITRCLLYKNTIPNASAVLFRRDLALSSSAIDERLRYCGDWSCWINMLLRSNVAFLPDGLNYWRQAHPASVRSNVSAERRIADILEIFKSLWARGLVDKTTLIQALSTHYRHWWFSALREQVPWKTHREIVRQFSTISPRILWMDSLIAPLFLAFGMIKPFFRSFLGQNNRCF